MTNDSSLPPHEVERQRFVASLTFLNEARQLVEDAQTDVIESLHALGRSTPLGVRDELINDLYWHHFDVKPKDIAEAFGIKPSEITHGDIIKPHYRSDLACPTCGIPHLLASRNKMAELERDFRKDRSKRAAWVRLDCKPCHEARFADRRRQGDVERELRRERVNLLRTMPYREYLQTPEWQEKRKGKLRSAGYRCELCNSSNTVLDTHHKTYERRGDEYYKDLIVLCRACHARFHDKLEVPS